MNVGYTHGKLLFRSYTPENIDNIEDILKQFPEYTIEKIESLKKHKDHSYFYNLAFKKILLNLAKDELETVKPITISNIRRGEVVCLCRLAGISVTSACKAVNLKRNTFYDLESRYNERWDAYTEENRDFAAEQAEVIGMYLQIWCEEHIRFQFRVLELDGRKQETLIEEMKNTLMDPYSTEEDTIFKMYDAMSKRKQSQYSTLKKKH